MLSDKKLAETIPHERQIRFQQTEFYAFVHFTVNTAHAKNSLTPAFSPTITAVLRRSYSE